MQYVTVALTDEDIANGVPQLLEVRAQLIERHYGSNSELFANQGIGAVLGVALGFASEEDVHKEYEARIAAEIDADGGYDTENVDRGWVEGYAAALAALPEESQAGLLLLL